MTEPSENSPRLYAGISDSRLTGTCFYGAVEIKVTGSPMEMGYQTPAAYADVITATDSSAAQVEGRRLRRLLTPRPMA